MNDAPRPLGALLLTAALLAAACSKPKAFAPTDDFVHRHACPAGSVDTTEEGEGRVRVSGCGQSDVYVRGCENRAASVSPSREPREPVSEAEARFSDKSSMAPGAVGCAWSREPEPEIPLGPTAGE